MMGHENLVVVYYGVCLELENFITIVLWPKVSKTSNQAFNRIYDLITEDKRRDNVLKFGKGFDLELSNSIHPSRSVEISNIQKPRYIYDWEHVPFLKETGDTILSHNSPLNFRKVYLNETKLTKTYINIKTIIGRTLSFSNNQIEILIPSFFGTWKTYRAKVSIDVANKRSSSLLNTLNYFMILECINGNVEDVIKFVSPASPIDLIWHMLSFALYTLRLGSKRLCLLSFKEYEKLYKKCFIIIDNFCRAESVSYSNLWDPYNIFHTYLSPFFRLIDNEILFIPHNQTNLNDEILKIYDKCLLFGYDSINEVTKLSLAEKRLIKPYHHNIYDFIRLFIDLKRLLVWNEEREYLYGRLKSEIRL